MLYDVARAEKLKLLAVIDEKTNILCPTMHLGRLRKVSQHLDGAFEEQSGSL